MSTHDIELPQGYAERPFDYSGDLYIEGQVRAIVEANRALVSATLQAEIESLRAEVERLRADRGSQEQQTAHPAITHCDNCGCDWLDNGLNPIGCPYCKQSGIKD